MTASTVELTQVADDEPLAPPTLVAVHDAVTTVGVIAQDPVTLAGLTGSLGGCGELRLVSCRGERLPDVVVVAADDDDAASGPTSALIRACTALVGRSARVVVVVGDLDGPALLEVVEAGVTVVVPRREATDEHLLEAVRAAAEGATSLPSAWLRRLVGSPAPDAGSTPADPVRRAERRVSGREVEILRLLADGLSTMEMSHRLAYSESTIKASIHELTARLGLRNRPHAVAYALRAGLI